MDLNTKVKRSAICAGVSMVRSARFGSFSSFCSAACTVASIGTLVNSDSTSKDTKNNSILFRDVNFTIDLMQGERLIGRFYRKISCLTRKFRVKLHIKTDIAGIAISVFKYNLTRNSRVR